MSASAPDPPKPPRDLPSHRRQTERRLVLGFVLILLLVGGGLIAWDYGVGGLIGGLASILGCGSFLLGLGGLLWFILTLAGRWADRE